MQSKLSNLKANISLLGFSEFSKNKLLTAFEDNVLIKESGEVYLAGQQVYNDYKNDSFSDFNVQVSSDSGSLSTPLLVSGTKKSEDVLFSIEEDEPVLA